MFKISFSSVWPFEKTVISFIDVIAAVVLLLHVYAIVMVMCGGLMV